jgi:LuxR family maltose regulon positive regulatory protein
METEVRPPLLTTKLAIPPVRPRLVSRPRLTKQLGRALDRKLTLISAPAGFGKTTLVCEWLSDSGIRSDHGSAPEPDPMHRRVAWLSLDPSDNDPARFLAYLAAALGTVEPEWGGAAREFLHSPQPPPATRMMTWLINEIAAEPLRLVLVLDDYHVITARPVHDVLAHLLDHAPANLHVIILTRADPPLSLARRRVRGELIEIRQADLCFSAEETAAWLNDIMDLGLTPGQISALRQRTEGWIAGLVLAGLSLKRLADVEGVASFVGAFAGSHRYVMDYLLEEVVSQQPQEVQSFLLQTSILDRMSGALCDAVTGRSGSQEIIEGLDQANLFVIPLDDRRHWYRYHALFADLIRDRLHHLQPELVPELHRRASEWYERHGSVVAAVSHALSTSDSQYAAALMERQVWTLLDRGEMVLITSWLRHLAEGEIRARPFLCLARAWGELYDPSRSMRSAAKAADQWVTAAEGAMTAGLGDSSPDQGRFASHVAALRARLAWRRGDTPEEVLEAARHALRTIPQDNLHLRSIVLYVLGATYGGLAHEQAAIEALAGAQEAAEASGNLRIALLSACIRAYFAYLQGHLQHAAETCWHVLREYVEPYEESGRVLPMAGAVYVVLGTVLLEWNELGEAERTLVKGMKLLERVGHVDPFISQWGYEAQVRLRKHCGDILGAQALFGQMKQVVPADDSFAAVQQVRLWLWQAGQDRNALSAAVRWAEERQIELDYSGRHSRTQLALVRVLIAQRRASPAASSRGADDLDRILRVLEGQFQAASEIQRVPWMIETGLLQALARQAWNDGEGALAALHKALDLARPEGYMRIFLDEGEPMRQLLILAAARGIMPEFVTRLLAAFRDTPGLGSTQPRPMPTSGVAEPLTERELEVLRLIAAGLRNQEIADHLVISLATVKRHISNLYGKLGVTHRTQAVARAREMDLLYSTD